MTASKGRIRVDIDLEHAAREAGRVARMLARLRARHDLTRFEYTLHVRVVPASQTYSHPILTLGTRFAETEDHLLATYLHEQMHWYLWRLGGPDHDPVEAFFDELVRRYPKAPTQLPEGARSYEQTYLHIVVCFLELKAVAEFIGFDRAAELAKTQYGYRWIYKTVLRDWDDIERLLTDHGVLPMASAEAMDRREARKVARKPRARVSVARRKKRAAKRPPPSRKSRRKRRARGGRSRA
jgi:hypothetical protein